MTGKLFQVLLRRCGKIKRFRSFLIQIKIKNKESCLLFLIDKIFRESDNMELIRLVIFMISEWYTLIRSVGIKAYNM